MPLLALIAVTAVWGVTFVQVKDAVDVYPLFAFLAVRYAIATGVLAVAGGRRVLTLGRSGFAEWHTGRELSGRMVAQRTASPRSATGTAGAPGDPAAADLDSPPSSTIRLRPAAARRRTETAPPLPRLVVVVDDLEFVLSSCMV